MYWIIGAALWLAGGFLFVSRICRFDAPEEDHRAGAGGDRPVTRFSAGDHSLFLCAAVSAAHEPAPEAGTLVLMDGRKEAPRAASSRFGGRIIADEYISASGRAPRGHRGEGQRAAAVCASGSCNHWQRRQGDGPRSSYE